MTTTTLHTTTGGAPRMAFTTQAGRRASVTRYASDMAYCTEHGDVPSCEHSRALVRRHPLAALSWRVR